MNEICPGCGQPMNADECTSERLTRHKRDQDRAFWDGFGGLPGPALNAAYDECDRLERERDEAHAEVDRLTAAFRADDRNWRDAVAAVWRERDEARAEVDRLRASLHAYEHMVLVRDEEIARFHVRGGRRLVVVESPFAGDVELHLAYLRRALADCLRRGEAPFASHGLYTQPGVLDDDDPDERRLGIEAGFDWATVADARVVYVDLGISAGMMAGVEHARAIGQPVEFRRLAEESPT